MSEMTDLYELTDLLRGRPDDGPERGSGRGSECAGGLSPAAGQVWAARHRGDDHAVAIKLLADAGRAHREADIARAVGHPHVLVPEAIVEAEDATGLVIPLAAGGSVAALLAARNRLPWQEVLTVLIPLADALSAAHERDLIHGDISTGNILLDAIGRPLLADFGAARAAAERGGTVAATPTTAAPELARGASPDTRSDLFSLGAVAVWCLTGRPAWPAGDLRDVLVQSAAGQWPDVPDSMAPVPLVAAVRQLLAAEPGKRGSAARLAVALREMGVPAPLGGAGAGGPRAAIPATVVRPDALRPPAARNPVPRHRRIRTLLPAIVGAGIAATLLAGALTVGWWWAGSGGSGTAVVAAPPPTPAQHPPSRESDRPGPSPAAAEPSPTALEEPGYEPDTDPEEPDWRAVVETLDWARAAALQARDAELLDAVYTDGAAPRRDDGARIDQLRAEGLRPDLAVHRIESVRVLGRRTDGTVTLAVRSSLPSVTIYDDDGTVAGHTGGSDTRQAVMTVVPESDGYLIAAIEE